MAGWILFAFIMAVMIWGLWPQITGLFDIRANDGDDRLVNIKSVPKAVKPMKRKLTRK